MSFIGNLLGGNNGGANFQAQSANVQNPLTTTQANQAAQGYTNAQGLSAQAAQGLSQDQMQSLMQVLGQQQNVAQQQGTAQGALGQQQGLVNAAQAQNGLGNQSSVYAQQQGLANQLGAMAQGAGPNPAQAQLAQNTAANTANQAALMAGQRGAGSNTGLLARQAAQQGAATQQQSAGQAATLQAQQQLSAIGALQGQQQNLANLATTQAGQQIGATNALTSAAQAQQGLGLQGQNLAQQYGLGQQQIGLGQEQNALGQQNAALTNQGQILGATAAQNTANVANAASQNSANAGVAQQVAKSQSGLLGGVLGGIGSALGLAQGGVVPAYADGGIISQMGQGLKDADDDIPKNTGSDGSAPAQQGGASKIGQFLGGTGSALAGMAGNGLSLLFAEGGQVGSNAILKENYSKGPKSKTVMYLTRYARGGSVKKVDALVSPGEVVLSKEKAKKVKEGKAHPLDGKVVPGQARVKGAVNSYANDTVPMKLEAGGIVIPRSVTESKNPGEAAKRFIEALKAKKGK